MEEVNKETKRWSQRARVWEIYSEEEEEEVKGKAGERTCEQDFERIRGGRTDQRRRKACGAAEIALFFPPSGAKSEREQVI